MKRKLIGLTTAVLTLVSMAMAKEKTVNDGSIGRYVTVEMDTTGTKNFNAVEEVKYRARFPKGPQMVKIPGKNFEMMETEVTQEIYVSVMGENPSPNKGDYLPVVNVSWYDAIMFCNKLSIKDGLIPVYAVDGNTDITKWNYIPHKGKTISGKITVMNGNGYSLSGLESWKYVAKGNENFRYAGSDILDEVGWYNGNGGGTIHPVGEKKPNGFGLYDMNGNVWEWCDDYYVFYGKYVDYEHEEKRCNLGGSYDNYPFYCDQDFYSYDWWTRDDYYGYGERASTSSAVIEKIWIEASCQRNDLGFRIVRYYQ